MRDQPPEFWDQFNASPPPGAHLRIHPILHWTEADIWAYTKRENIPIIPLYLAKDGKRYRSLGDADITNPVASDASNIEEILIELDSHQGAGARRARARSRNRRRLRAAARRRLSLNVDIAVERCHEHDPSRRDIGDAERHHAPAGPHRHRRPCRSRQIHAGRTAAARDRQPARGQAGDAQGRQRPARHAVRMVVPARCAADRARPGHHHRHHADPLPHRLARHRADRRARPRRIPAQHDHRRFAGRRRGADHRRAGRRARPDPAPRLSLASARRQTGRGRRQQDGPGRFQRCAI